MFCRSLTLFSADFCCSPFTFPFADEATHHFSLLLLFRSQIASPIVFVTRWWLLKFFHSDWRCCLLTLFHIQKYQFAVFMHLKCFVFVFFVLLYFSLALFAFRDRYLWFFFMIRYQDTSENAVIHRKILCFFLSSQVTFIYKAKYQKSASSGFTVVRYKTPSILRLSVYMKKFGSVKW